MNILEQHKMQLEFKSQKDITRKQINYNHIRLDTSLKFFFSKI